MKRQTLLYILVAIVFLPVMFFLSKREADSHKLELEQWRSKRTEFYDWIAKNPEKIKDRPDREVIARQLRSKYNSEWLAHHPEVAQAIAAISSATAPPTHTNGHAAAVPSAAAPTGEVPVARREFLDRLREQSATGDYELKTKTITAHLSPIGGTVSTLSFNDLRDSSFRLVAGNDRPLKDLGPFQEIRIWDDAFLSFALTSKTAGEDLASVQWLHESLPDGGHRFRRVLPDGDLVINKDYLVATPTKGSDYDDYHFVLRVSVENTSPTNGHTFNYALAGSTGLIEPTTSSPLPLEAAIGVRDEQGGYRCEKKSALDVFKEIRDTKASLKVQAPSKQSRIAFYGLAEKQFACVVIPQDEALPIEGASADTLLDLLKKTPGANDEAAFKSQEPNIAKEIVVTGARSEFRVDAGKTVSQDFVVFAGPLWKELLESHPIYAKANLGELVNYQSIIPGVKWLAILLTKLLVGFHWLTGSWGMSIILLTVLVRACLHPLMVKQTKSTQKMQALGPEINKIKEKYQDKDGNMSAEDQKKFQAEQMEVWRKHGINPLGCMGPMLLQLPILYGLWNSLRYAFELRQASFLWIRDLTEPDVIFRLPFNLPMHGTNALCILPIIMLFVYIFQMRTMPKSPDPQQQEQQKIMQWMMPVMGYMFYAFQSGLLLYYITSSILGMVEQRWIKKRLGIVTPPAGTVPAKV